MIKRTKYNLFEDEEIFEKVKLRGKPLPTNSEEFEKLNNEVYKRNYKKYNNYGTEQYNNHEKELSDIFDYKKADIKNNQENNILHHSPKELIIKVGKVCDAPKTTSRQMAQMLYISRMKIKEESEEMKQKNSGTELYDSNNNIIDCQEEVENIINKWYLNPHRKIDSSISRHITISIGGKDESRQKALFAIKLFLEDTFASRGFDYVYAPHYDSENDHFHVIVEQRNYKGENLRIIKSNIEKMRKKCSNILASVGIKREVTNKLERKETLQNIKDGITDLNNGDSWYHNNLKKGQSLEFNAHHYKITLSNKMEEEINLIKVQSYLNSLNVEDKTLIKAIKPYIVKYGFKSVETSLKAVKEAQEKKDIDGLNGFILTAIKSKYSPNNKRFKNFELTSQEEGQIKKISEIKKEIIQKDNKKDIIQTLDSSLNDLESNDSILFEKLNKIFTDRIIRYSYVQKVKPYEKIGQAIERKKDVQYKAKKENYYRPEITDYEAQEKFADAIRKDTNISPVGLETAIANAFLLQNQAFRFGHNKSNEVKWYGEVGYVKSYKTDEYFSWSIHHIKQDGKIEFTKISKEEMEQKLKEQEEKRIKLEAEKLAKQEEVAEKSQYLMSVLSKNPTKENNYLERKGVQDINLNNVAYKDNGDLVIPMQDIDGKVWNLQSINSTGEKRFELGGKKQGNFFIISEDKNLLSSKNPILLTEGLATGLSVFRCTDNMNTIVCFDAKNLINVATSIKEKYPQKEIIIFADDGSKNERKLNGEEKISINVGLISAYKVQEKFPDIKVIKPKFTEEEKIKDGLSNFNDFEQRRGTRELKQEIKLEKKSQNLKSEFKLGLKL